MTKERTMISHVLLFLFVLAGGCLLSKTLSSGAFVSVVLLRAPDGYLRQRALDFKKNDIEPMVKTPPKLIKHDSQ